MPPLGNMSKSDPCFDMTFGTIPYSESNDA